MQRHQYSNLGLGGPGCQLPSGGRWQRPAYRQDRQAGFGDLATLHFEMREEELPFFLFIDGIMKILSYLEQLRDAATEYGVPLSAAAAAEGIAATTVWRWNVRGSAPKLDTAPFVEHSLNTGNFISRHGSILLKTAQTGRHRHKQLPQNACFCPVWAICSCRTSRPNLAGCRRMGTIVRKRSY